MQRPKPTAGLRHVALCVNDIAACERFYVELMGMSVEWRPDEANLYLTTGVDNLALHHEDDIGDADKQQRLDHIGFIIDMPEQVDEWYEFLLANEVKMRTKVKAHRDGARSFYCYDPEGNTVQIIYHPPISKGAQYD